MSETEEPPIDLDFQPVDESSGEELVEQHSELAGHIHPGYQPHIHNWHETVHERCDALWSEIRNRTETDEPPCPDCGGRRWGQAAGDPVHCRQCGHEGPAETENAVHEAWDAMISEVKDGK
jgi:predicted RNA-binding Zn-ribbon protein involved in translation (DUF1610 family)